MNSTKRVAYFDPFSGASGDMVLGAMIDAGVSLGELRAELQGLPVQGYEITAKPVESHAVRGTQVTVEVTEKQPSRSWTDIQKLIEESEIDHGDKRRALSWFGFLAEAEAVVHGVPVDQVHFHEVGAVDSIVDVCGAAVGMRLLGVEQIFYGPIRLGTGLAPTAHGLLPIPAPATAAMLQRRNAVLTQEGPEVLGEPGELLTPTGAAILLADGRPGRPAMTAESVAYGFGQRVFSWPNALGLWIGATAIETDDATDAEAEMCRVLETNIDDMNPQAYELLIERLFAAGALDVWTAPIGMKKSRTGVLLSVLSGEAEASECTDVLLRDSTTLGVRTYQVTRQIADRVVTSVVTRFGDVRVKAKGLDGRVISVQPEYDDVVLAARETHARFEEVWFEAKRISESQVGRKIAEL